MLKFLELFFDSAILWVAAYFCGKMLLGINKRPKLLNILLVIALFSLLLGLLNTVNSEILDGIVKLLTVYILQCLYFKFMFNKGISKSMIVAVIWYFCLMLSEIIVVVLSSAILGLLSIPLLSLKNSIFVTIPIAIVTWFSIYKLKNKLIYFVNNNQRFEKSILIIMVTILITIALIGYKRTMDKWYFDFEFVFTMGLLICVCLIGFYLVKQRSDILKTSNMYNKLVDYSKTTNKLLEDYRLVNHEHKNQLSIIRTMTNKDNRDLIEYIDNLLDKKNVVKYQWIADLNNLPSEGLKGLINYKLIEMENNMINPTVTISKDVSKFKLNKLSTKEMDNLYSIIGVYLDNAIQAASSSKEKEISLDIYKENKELVMILANSYKDKIDINKIDEYGYTTKGKGHGVGLHLVRKILDEEKSFTQTRKIIDNYYIQELRINFAQKRKNK